MFLVYILYSEILDKYYIGETMDIDERINQHNSGHYSDSFTKTSNDWTLYYSLECDSRNQARKIEGHIKRMKSRKYIADLKNYPEIAFKLKNKY